MTEREDLVEEHGEEAVVDLEEPFISGVESFIHDRQYDDEELDYENACVECGDEAHTFYCPSCGRPLCSMHCEVLGGYCSDYAGRDEGCQIEEAEA